MADELLQTVRGVNPVTGAAPGVVERVASDDVVARLAIAVRTMPVGSFQALNGDNRGVEASCRAAETLVELFGRHGIEFKVADKNKNDDLPRATEVDINADDGRSAQPENKHEGTDDDVARSNEQQKLTREGSSSHPVTDPRVTTTHTNPTAKNEPASRHHEEKVQTDAKASSSAKSK